MAKLLTAYPTKEALMKGVVTVMCPYCEEEKQIEPDKHYDDVVCEVCGGHYSTMGVI